MGIRSVVAPAALIAALVGSAFAGRVDSTLEATLARSSENVRVIVTFKNRTPIEARSAKSPAAKVALLHRFQKEAEEAQASTREFLATRTAASMDVRSLWITNSLVLTASPALVRELAARPDVDGVFLDEIVTLEQVKQEPIPKREQQILDEGPTAPGDTAQFTYGLIKVKIPELRQVYANLSGEGVKVGLIDTGIDASHPDLQGKVLLFKDFVNNKPDPYDDQGHGSHCAGTIAGGATSGLSIGVAPKAKLLVAKVFTSSGTANTEHILAAMQWIADPDGNPSTQDTPAVCSNSWGGGPGRKVFLEATKKWVALGIFPSFAAGNSGPGAGTVGTPGGFLESFAVGATDVNDAVADFSSRGPVTWDEVQTVKPDVSAPGKAVTSVKAGGGYTALSGTSMATPHVSGVLALLYQANPQMTIEQARDLLERTSEDKGEPGKDNHYGAGRMNALNAAQILVSGGKIAGTLTDADGGAAIRGVVTVAENGFAVKTDASGKFNLILPAGTYTLTARAFGYQEQTGLSVQVAAAQTADLGVQLTKAPGGTLAGKVLSAETNEPLNAKITVLDTPLDPVATQGTGEFSLGLPAGNYKIQISAFGYDPLTVDNVAVAAGETGSGEYKLNHLPSILIVADDLNKGYEKYPKAALDALAKKYSVVNAAQTPSVLTGEFLQQYQVVIWMTGDAYSDTLTVNDQVNLQKFVQGGGGLFITGQDVGYDIKESPFYKDVLKAKWIADSVNTKTATAGGVSFGIEGGTGASNQRYADRIQGLNGATTFAEYGNGLGAAGLATTHGTGRVVYMSFGYEGIDSDASRQAVLKAVLGYLTPSVSERAARIAGAEGVVQSAQTQAMTGDVAGMRSAELNELKAAVEQGLAVPRDVRRAMNARLMEQAAR